MDGETRHGGESGVNLEVLGGGVLEQQERSNREEERGEDELQKAFEIPG